MKLYAERPHRLVRQVVFDVAVLAWLLAWWRIANAVNAEADKGMVGAQKLQTSASSLSGNLTDAGQRLRKVPLVGDTLQEPFDKSAGAADQISASGHQIALGIDDLGNMLGYLTAAAPYLFVALLWFVVRGPYLRKASQATKLRATAAGMDVLALRALQHRSGAELFAVSAGPAAGWRNGDAETTRALGELYLRRLGLRPGKAEQISSRAAGALPVTNGSDATGTAPAGTNQHETDDPTDPQQIIPS